MMFRQAQVGELQTRLDAVKLEYEAKIEELSKPREEQNTLSAKFTSKMPV